MSRVLDSFVFNLIWTSIALLACKSKMVVLFDAIKLLWILLSRNSTVGIETHLMAEKMLVSYTFFSILIFEVISVTDLWQISPCCHCYSLTRKALESNSSTG